MVICFLFGWLVGFLYVYSSLIRSDADVVKGSIVKYNTQEIHMQPTGILFQCFWSLPTKILYDPLCHAEGAFCYIEGTNIFESKCWHFDFSSAAGLQTCCE